jgi:hypothetical protein
MRARASRPHVTAIIAINKSATIQRRFSETGGDGSGFIGPLGLPPARDVLAGEDEVKTGGERYLPRFRTCVMCGVLDVTSQ